MAEYIEREAAQKFLAQDYAYAAADLLKYVPAADVVEVRRGEWILDKDNDFYCSACKKYPPLIRQTNFCPKCGADMRGKE